MAFGADLIADDRTALSADRDGPPVAAPVAPIAGLIEARGVGILPADTGAPARISLIVDMGAVESDRLPPTRARRLMGWTVPLLHKVESPHFPAAVLQYLKGIRP